jgi:hypothetical protein
MRLTSYNIAAKRLKAGCCLAIHVENMWRYMEEGDMVNAQCAREKALMLDALISTLGRWKPTIATGYKTTFISIIESGTYVFPFFVYYRMLNGMALLNPYWVTGNDNQDVLNTDMCQINSFVSPNDDTVKLTSNVYDGVLIWTIISPEQITSIESSTSVNNIVHNSTLTDEEHVGVPPCLTDAQVLSIIKKIDELCEAECGC